MTILRHELSKHILIIMSKLTVALDSEERRVSARAEAAQVEQLRHSDVQPRQLRHGVPHEQHAQVDAEQLKRAWFVVIISIFIHSENTCNRLGQKFGSGRTVTHVGCL